jgi:uncharacterized protein YkwD
MAIEGFAAHQHPVTGERVSDRVLAQGYNYLAVGENLEFGGCTANWVVNEWLNSTSGHRENLLNATFTEIGMGVYQGGAERMYWVQVLGTSQGGQADPGNQVSGDGCAPGADMAALAAAAITFTNDARAAVGVAPVTENAALTAAALSHSQSMAVQGFVGHEDPATGERVNDRVLAQGYSYFVVAENIATGICAADTVVNEWLNSTGHRENLLSPDYTEIGIGVYQGGEQGMYWVQVFATPW